MPAALIAGSGHDDVTPLAATTLAALDVRREIRVVIISATVVIIVVPTGARIAKVIAGRIVVHARVKAPPRLRRAHAPHKLGLGSDCAVLDRGRALRRGRHDSVIVAFDRDGGALVPGRALSRGAQARQRQQQHADDAPRRVRDECLLMGAALLLRRRHRAGRCCPVFTPHLCHGSGLYIGAAAHRHRAPVAECCLGRVLEFV
mmetsp:Transcript_8913/g.25689  ORF Transcript_8913/g.25689 Transcript_8913/m.25689 type:complete len:203 (-) Transcript_8913:69-677(-)